MKRFAKLTRATAFVAAGALLITAAACNDDDDDDGMMGPSPRTTFQQVDRFGLPAINTVFIPSEMKQPFNRAIPSNDPNQFRDEVIATLNAFGVMGDAAEGLADAVLPDIQPIDTSQPTAFLNGRAPADDVITAELMLIFGDNGDLNDDNVDANDVPFLNTFPFLAEPH